MKAGFDQTEREREREREREGCKAKARRCRIRGWLSSIVFSFHGVLSRFLHPVLLVRTAFPAEMKEEKEKEKEVKYEEKSSRFSFPSRFILLHECVRSTIAWKTIKT